jgi:hypothetical protein
MARIESEHSRLELAVQQAVELELAESRADGRLPSVGFYRLPPRRHADVFPPLHGLLQDFMPADANAAREHEALSGRLTDLDREARMHEDENVLSAVETVLRYGLVNEIQIGWLLGEPLPFAALQHVEQFSVRNTWIGVIDGPLSPDEGAIYQTLSPELAGKSEIGFVFGPGFTHFFEPSEPVALDSVVVSRSQADITRRVSLEFNGTATEPRLRLNVAEEEQAERVQEAVAPPLTEAPETGGYSINYANATASDGWIPLLYTALDGTAVSISQELRGLSRPRTDARFLAMRLSERYDAHVEQNDRERSYLEIATKQLTRDARVAPHLAQPLFLPDPVLTPGELEYRALGSVLSALQDAMSRAGSDSPLTQLLKGDWEAIGHHQDELVAQVRHSRRRLEHQVSSEGVTQHFLFHATLKSFSPDSEEIKRSLIRQAKLLQVLNSLSDYRIELHYRFYTAFARSGELGARFEVEATAEDCDAAEAASLRESFGELIHAAFVGAYSLTFTFALPEARPGEERNLRHPRFERQVVRGRRADGFQSFLGRPDWGYIVDYLLTLDHPVAINLRARAGGRANAPVVSAGVEWPAVGEESAARVLDDVLHRVGQAQEQIQLLISVGSNQEISPTLMNLVGTQVSGGAGFEVTDANATLESERIRMPLAEAFAVFHAPYGEFFARRMGHHVTRIPSTVDSFPVAGIELGMAHRAHAKADRKISVRIPEIDALRHIYVVGRTGSGKTNFLRGLATQHLVSPGTGLAIIDPHGDLASHVLNSVPPARVEEVVTVDVTDPEYMPVLNPLEFDASDALARSRVVQDVLDLIKQRLYHEWSGPRFDEVVRLALDTMLDPGYPAAASLTDMPRVLTDERLQAALIKRLRDPELIARWEFQKRLSNSREYPELMDWVVSKFDEISRDETLRMIFGGERNTVDIEEVVANNGILIVRLPEAEVGRQAAETVGSLVLQQLRRALLRRKPSGVGGHFFVYVDEFQKFATTAFAELVAEARKYGVGIVLAHQNLEQLRIFSPQSGERDQSLLSAILGNVGSMICFGVGAPDTQILAAQLGVSGDAVAGIGRYEALARISVDGAWVPAMSLVTQFNEPRLDPRRQDEVREYQISVEQVFPRSGILRQIESRRVSLGALLDDGGQEPRMQVPTPASSFLEGWRKKRQVATRTATDESGEDNKTGSNGANAQERGEPSDASRVPDVVTPGSTSGVPDPPPSEPSGWAELVGPVVRLERLAEILGEPVEVLRGRAELGRLLILRTRRGTEVVPASHFADGALLPGLEEVLEPLAYTGWSAWSRAGWLATPLVGLGDKTIIEWLRDGLGAPMPAAIARARVENG